MPFKSIFGPVGRYGQTNVVIQNDATVYTVNVSGGSWSVLRTVTLPVSVLGTMDSELRGLTIQHDAAGPGIAGQKVRLFVNGIEQTPLNTDESNYPTYTADIYNILTIPGRNVPLTLEWRAYHDTGTGNHYIKNIGIEGRYVLSVR
jgi:hypothetical protein